MALSATDFLAVRTSGQLEARKSIDDLEASIRAAIDEGEIVQTLHDGETDEGHNECQHCFGDGVYARSILIPAGTVVVGRIHKQARICIIAQGRCEFVDEFHRETVEAPWMGEFLPGSKTAVFAHTDTVWVAVVGTDMKDPKEILGTLSAKTHEDFDKHAALLEKKS